MVTEIAGPRVEPAKELAKQFLAAGYDGPLHVESNIARAYDLALEDKRDGMLFIAGSLYLVGEIKKL